MLLCIQFLLLHLSGCATMGPALMDETLTGIPSKSHVDAVPFISQSDYQCGPAALAMVLQHSGVDVSAETLKSAVYTPHRKGSLQSGLVTAARRYERLAYPIYGLDSLLREVAGANPVIVMQNLGLKWITRWHYAVVVGYDLEAQTMTLHSGKIPNRKVALSTFRYTWMRAHQWGLLVLSPDRLPVSVQVPDYLKAALGLQQAGFPESAELAFQAAVERWPRNMDAMMGLGNAKYQSGHLQAAAKVFQEVVAIDPQHGAAFNNLAHILAELGDFEAALLAARQAVALGGAHEAIYRQTLQETLDTQQRQ
jgi:tetratricopeptide (TPR) repeat protein